MILLGLTAAAASPAAEAGIHENTLGSGTTKLVIANEET